MKNVKIVIGSGWGDEGKGKMTDILATSPDTLNVRFNGGAQASHTVVTPDGKRHAFRHLGAGTFAGAKTYLSEKFIVNPMAFVLERSELFDKFHISPIVIVNPNCIVSTPWDIYINQAIETLRGNDRHGSCGFGINETVERSANPKYLITVKTLLSEKELKEKLLLIKNEYLHERLHEEYNLEFSDLPKKYQTLLSDSNLINMFIFYAKEFIRYVQIHNTTIIDKFDNVVFEGAQGLLLDQNNVECYPHVTTSNTGIKNVMDILQELDYSGLPVVYYMSRCYLTKHGAGPLKGELEHKPYSKIIDTTNIPNDFQGKLRFAYLDFDLLSNSIKKDLTNFVTSAEVNLTFTCLDQLDDSISFISNNKLYHDCKKDFLRIAQNIISAKLPYIQNIHTTNGLTRDNIIW